MSTFSLRQRSATVLLFGYPIAAFGVSSELFCGLCKYRKELADEELSAAQVATCLYKRLAACELTPAQYTEALAALEFPALRALLDEGATWSCPTCKEKVPMTLNGCWKCNSPRPGLIASDAIEPGGLPPLPNDVTRPTHPWEQ